MLSASENQTNFPYESFPRERVERRPEKLVKRLFDKACALLKTSITALEARDTEAFHKASLHAIQIVFSLQFVLERKEGDELAESLFNTYSYIAASLLAAKNDKDQRKLLNIYESLHELRIAWDNMLNNSYTITQ